MTLKSIFKSFFSDPPIDEQSVYLFWDSTIHYPSWLKNGNEKHVWELVQSSTRNEKENRHDLILKNGDSFAFIEESIDKSYPEGSFKNIEIYYNKSIVASFDVTLEDVTANYILHRAEFIKEGNWQEVVKQFLTWKKEYDKIIEGELSNLANTQKISKMNKTLKD